MSSQHKGVDAFTELTTIPSDGDGPHIKAADVNPALQDNYNRAQYLRNRLVVNWPNLSDTDTASGDLVFIDKAQAWETISGAGAGTDKWAITWDNGGGPDWEDEGVSAPGFDLYALAANPAGERITFGASRNVYKTTYAYGTQSWTAGTNNLSVAPSGGDAAYDSLASVWIAVYRNGASGMVAENDTDAVGAWVVATLPATWTGYTGSNNPRLGAISGRAVAAFINATGPVVNIIRSSDGGGSWSANVAVTPTGFTPTHISKPVYDDSANSGNGAWFIMLGASGKTEVIKSTDHGASWSSVFTSTAFFGHDMATNRGALAIIGSDGRVYYSFNEGAAFAFFWRYVYTTPATRWIIRAGGGGFMALNNAEGNSRSTLRLGSGATP